MKNTLISYCFFIIPCIGNGQMFEAKYEVTTDVVVQLENIGEKKIATLSSTGFFFRKANKYIYFEKPNYLESYPDGYIRTEIAANHFHTMEFCMDSVQRLTYKDMDTLIKRYRMDMSGKNNVKFNYLQYFQPGFYNWEFGNETKEIQGLKCQKATLKLNGSLQWIVWFCPDIPMQTGILNISDLPGLMVEGDNIPLKSHFVLSNYSTNSDFSNEIFWPAEFNQPFEKRPDLKKSAIPNEKTRIQKQAELFKQY